MRYFLNWLFETKNDNKIIFCHGKKNNLPTQLNEIKHGIFSLAEFLTQQKEIAISLYCENIYHFYIGFYASLLANKTIILAPNNTKGLQENIIQVSKTTHLYYNENKQSFFFNDLMINDLYIKNLLKNIEHDLLEVNIIFFSSGSTGKPKKITKKFKHLVNEVNILNRFFNLDDDQMVTSSVHHQHLYGFIFYFLWPSLTHRLIYSERIQLSEELEQLIDHTDHFNLISSPAFLSRLTFQRDLSNILCFSAGSLLKTEIAQQLKAHFHMNITEILGSSETGIIAWRQQLTDPLWQCFDEVKITHNEDNTLRVYADSFIEPFIDTDDVVELIKPKQFILQGRKGRIVKLEDKRLSLNELEDRLKKHAWINDCYALKLEKSREYIGVFVVLSASGKEQKDHLTAFEFNNTLRHFLSHWFEKILLPKSFRYGDEIPVNAQSKIDREAILQLFTY